jgi:hypothetical protein
MARSGLLNMNVEGMLDVETQLAMLSLPPKLQTRLMNRVGMRIRTQWRKRVRAQKDAKASPFEPRKVLRTGKNKRQKKLMLTGLARALRVTRLTAGATEVGWQNAKMAMIASVHNSGMTLKSGASQLRRQKKSTPLMATREQAKRMRRLGYTRAIAGGKKRKMRPSVAWIIANIHYGQAGLILSKLNNEAPGPATWNVTVPAREWFGIANRQEVNDLVTYLIPQILNSPR